MNNAYLVTINEPHDHGSLGKCASGIALAAKTEDEAISLAVKDEMFSDLTVEDWCKIVPECSLVAENKLLQPGVVILRMHLMDDGRLPKYDKDKLKEAISMALQRNVKR